MKLEFAVCVKNNDYLSSLEIRKLYQMVSDEKAASHALLRVIDESGEDYLYPAEYFLAVELPPEVEQALRLAA